MIQGAKNDPILEERMYQVSSFNSHWGRSILSVFLSIEISGGNDITAEISQTTTIIHFTLLGVRFRLYSTACVTDQYRSRLMAHKCTMDDVQNNTSKAK